MNKQLERLWSLKTVRYALLAILTVMALISLLQGIRNALEFSQDFQWDATKTFTMRINPYDESLNPSGILDRYGFEEYYLQMEANQFPSLLMLLIPYTFLPPLAARYAWIISNLIFTVGIIVLLRQTFLKKADKYVFVAFMLLMIAGTPYRNQLGVGQHTLFAFFFFLLAVRLDEMEDSKCAYVFSVLSLFVCYFKYTLTVPLCIYFIYKRKYMKIIISAFFHVVLTLVAALWLDDSFINMIIKPLKVSSALSAEGGIDFGALLKGSVFAYLLAFFVMLFLLVMSFKLSKEMELQVISILILWSLIITYHRTYDFFVITVVLAFYLARQRDFIFKLWYAIVIAGVFFGLRIFSESAGSKIAVGIIYYCFTISMTYIVLKEGKKKNTEVQGEE
ncbi:MAG: glycosyltransferase 87 family protein [Lachnospiraceae bacterium]|nr:glycosyltransferase 87 family protein [Lachnospiraceae bacterium]